MAGGPHSIEEYRRGYEEEGRLRGFRSACGFVTATWALACPRCGKRDLAEIELSGRGTIAASTVQTVPSDEFVAEAPYAYVLVDLEEGGRMTGWVAGVSPREAIAIGEPVRFVRGNRAGVRFERVPKDARTP